MKVLIGYDNSECSDQALDGLRHAGLPSDTEVLLFAVSDMWPLVGDLDEDKPAVVESDSGVKELHPSLPPPAITAKIPSTLRAAREFALHQLEQIRAQLVPARERLKAEFPGWKVDSEAVADSPYTAMIDKAHSWGADLVVVGSHGWGALRRVFLGSTSLNVAMHAPCSVRISRGLPGPVEAPMRIVLGFDGSSHSEAALRAVAARRWLPGSVVRVISVVEPQALTFLAHHYQGDGEYAREIDGKAPDYRSWLEEACDLAVRRLRESGVEAELEMPDGDPKRLLVEMAESWGADCLFIGAQGQRGKEHASLGTVATAIATRAHCSVEITRPPRI